jgi:hypothetical protein
VYFRHFEVWHEALKIGMSDQNDRMEIDLDVCLGLYAQPLLLAQL